MPRPNLPPDSPSTPLTQAVVFVRVSTKVFEVPPVRDALVIGRKAPVKARIIGEAFGLLKSGEFSRLVPARGPVGSILVRTALLRRIGPRELRRLIDRRVSCLMTSQEVLALRIEVETTLSA